MAVAAETSAAAAPLSAIAQLGEFVSWLRTFSVQFNGALTKFRADVAKSRRRRRGGAARRGASRAVAQRTRAFIRPWGERLRHVARCVELCISSGLVELGESRVVVVAQQSLLPSSSLASAPLQQAVADANVLRFHALFLYGAVARHIASSPNGVYLHNGVAFSFAEEKISQALESGQALVVEPTSRCLSTFVRAVCLADGMEKFKGRPVVAALRGVVDSVVGRSVASGRPERSTALLRFISDTMATTMATSLATSLQETFMPTFLDTLRCVRSLRILFVQFPFARFINGCAVDCCRADSFCFRMFGVVGCCFCSLPVCSFDVSGRRQRPLLLPPLLLRPAAVTSTTTRRRRRRMRKRKRASSLHLSSRLKSVR